MLQILTLSLLLMTSSVVVAQESTLRLKLVLAKGGKPLADQHMLIAIARDEHEMRWNRRLTEFKTDKDGELRLPYPKDAQLMQIWVDWYSLCQEDPNSQSVSIPKIMADGLVINHCGSQSFTANKGQLVVAVREETFLEKMRH